MSKQFIIPSAKISNISEIDKQNRKNKGKWTKRWRGHWRYIGEHHYQYTKGTTSEDTSYYVCNWKSYH